MAATGLHYGPLSYQSAGRVFPRSRLRENPFPVRPEGWRVTVIPPPVPPPPPAPTHPLVSWISPDHAAAWSAPGRSPAWAAPLRSLSWSEVPS